MGLGGGSLTLRLAPLALGAMLGCGLADPGGQGLTEGPRCDPQALKALSEQLDNDSPWAGIEWVWPGLEAACREVSAGALLDALAPYGRGRSVDGEAVDRAQTLIESACPTWDAVRREIGVRQGTQTSRIVIGRCALQRYDVLDRAEWESGLKHNPITALALHQWLLDQGLDPSTARPITRALLAHGELRVLYPAPPPGFVLASLPGSAVDETARTFAVRVGLDAIEFEDEKVEVLEAGTRQSSKQDAGLDGDDALISTLRGHIARVLARSERRGRKTRGWGLWLVLADARVPAQTAFEVLQVGSDFGFEDAAFVTTPTGVGPLVATAITTPSRRLRDQVESEREAAASDPRHEPVADGMSDATPAQERPPAARQGTGIDGHPGKPEASVVKATYITLEIHESHCSLGVGGADESHASFAIDDAAALAAHAQAITRAQPQIHWAVISVSPTVPIRRVLALVTALRGRSCQHNAEDKECRIHTVVWTDRPAHGVGATGVEARAAGHAPAMPEGSALPIVDARDLPRVKVTFTIAKLMGAGSKSALQKVTRRELPAVKTCYARELTRDPGLAGNVKINFVITAAGRVASSVVEQTETKNLAVANCIAKSVKTWLFPGRKRGEHAVATISFNLAPS